MPETGNDTPKSERAGLMLLIELRLREIGDEYAHLLALYRMYGGGATPPAADGQRTKGGEAPAAAGQERGAKARNAPPDTSKPGGTTESIQRIARERPGLPVKEFTDAVEVIVNSDADDKRRTISSTLNALIKKERIVRRDGRIYPVSHTNGDGREHVPPAINPNLFSMS